MGGMSKSGSEFNVGRSGAKKLASSRKTTLLTRAVGKLAGPLGAIIETLIPRTANAPSVSEWKKQNKNYKGAKGSNLFELADHEKKNDARHGFGEY